MRSTPPATGEIQAGFDDFYRVNYRSVVYVAYATTRSLGDAEELAQEAFTQLYQRWEHVDQPRAWIRRAIASLSTSWVRRRVADRAMAVDPPSEVAAEDSSWVEIWSALDTLSPRQRAAVVMKYVDDMSEREIATALGCRPGTVKSALSRARETLRKQLSSDRPQ